MSCRPSRGTWITPVQYALTGKRTTDLGLFQGNLAAEARRPASLAARRQRPGVRRRDAADFVRLSGMAGVLSGTVGLRSLRELVPPTRLRYRYCRCWLLLEAEAIDMMT